MDTSSPDPAATKRAFSTRELVITRILDAPRSLVFTAWTDAAHVAKWWGPDGFTNPVCEIDARPGGALRIVMRSPDGEVDYPMTGTYLEVVPPERIVFDWAALDAQSTSILEGRTTVTFDELDGKTKLTLRARGVALSEASVVMLDGMEEGWNQSLDRFEQHVSAAVGAADFVVTRELDAPRELVFRAWTDAGHLAKWFGPAGVTLHVRSLDLWPGGVFLCSMQPAAGSAMWGKWTFVEIAPPERLVVIVSFCDERGTVVRHPFAPGWPLETLSTTTFAEHDGKTEMTIRWRPYNATQSEIDTFAAGRDSMTQGWNGTFAQLEEFLARTP